MRVPHTAAAHLRRPPSLEHEQRGSMKLHTGPQYAVVQRVVTVHSMSKLDMQHEAFRAWQRVAARRCLERTPLTHLRVTGLGHMHA